MRRRPAEIGFTLLEVVVALTILALMAGIIYGSLRVAANSYSRSQQRMEKQARERVLRDFMRRQLGSLFPLLPAGSFLPEEGESLEGQENVDPTTLALAPLFEGTPRTVTFITVAPFMHLRNPGLTVVTYGRAEDEQGREYLGAMETRFTDVNSFYYMADIPRGKPLPIVEGVEDVRFSYYGYNPDNGTYGWFDEWSGEDSNSVPSAVRVDFEGQQIIVPINATDFGANQRGAQLLQMRRSGAIPRFGQRRR